MKNIQLLALDIDGVLTDGRAIINGEGEAKRIAFQDLDAVFRIRRAGVMVALVTGEDSPAVDDVASRFGVDSALVRRGAKDKVAALQELSASLSIPLSALCYIGDGDRDAPAFPLVGLSFAPANGTNAARGAAHRILRRSGGDGAVAEAVELLETMRAASDDSAVFQRIFTDSIAAHQRLLDESLPVLQQVADAMVAAICGGRKIMLFGNGGSAADAQHVAGEIVGRFLKESQPWPAMALTTDSSILTCVGNDWEFEDVFGRQVRALARPGDVVAGITTSGKSPNVLKGLADARAKGAITIGFTGANGTMMKEFCDICFLAPATATPRIQELHLLAWHAICEIAEVRIMAGLGEK